MNVQIDPHRKLTGILVPVFALRSSNDLGVGDTECVRQMIDWCACHQFSLFQVLPINEIGDDHSPYSAVSSMALDPTTIAIAPGLIPEISEKAFKRLTPPSLLEELRRGAVQYRKVKALKWELLREAFAQFLKKHHAKNSKLAQEFRAFMTAHKEWITDYALFRTLMWIHQDLPVWEDWPPEHHTPTQARNWMISCPVSERRALEERMLFFCYVQWLAYRQWSSLKQYGDRRGVCLVGDVPFGVSRCSADVWANQSIFDLRWSCGAPPETFFKSDSFTERWGQNWGIPLYRWDRMKEDRYAWWRSRLRGVSELFHFFRIDHVLGFYRVYAFPWKPSDNHLYTNLTPEEARAKVGDLPCFWPGDDNDPHQKLVNQQQGEELLHMILDAAEAAGVIAEDLGMVPDYVRPSLTRLGIPTFKIPLFERNPDGSYKDSARYEPLSVATLGTHDHEPIAVLWKRWQKSPEGAVEIRHLLHWIGWDIAQPPQEFTIKLHTAIAQKLLACSSWLVVFMITDFFALTQRFNVPGPMNEENWTERLTIPVEKFGQDPGIVSILQVLEPYLVRKD